MIVTQIVESCAGYMGCYADVVGFRDLNQFLVYPLINMTSQLCANFCIVSTTSQQD